MKEILTRDEFIKLLNCSARRFNDMARAGLLPRALNPMSRIEVMRWRRADVQAYLDGTYKGPMLEARAEKPRKAKKLEIVAESDGKVAAEAIAEFSRVNLNHLQELFLGDYATQVAKDMQEMNELMSKARQIAYKYCKAQIEAIKAQNQEA